MLFSNDSNVQEEKDQTDFDDKQIWTLEFDGSCAKAGSGAGVVLSAPNGEITCLAYKLDFKNTNNTAEYEALLLGMEATKQRGVKLLKVQGDAKLVVRQIRK